MIFWLVMYTIGSGSYMLHVGNFSTMPACLSAANSPQFGGRGGGSVPAFACVQANYQSTKPSPN
jgi:hypothetical protein